MIPPFKPFENIPMPYRYRDNAGSTRQSITALRNLPKLGEITLIQGLRWKTRHLGIREGVMVKNNIKQTGRFTGMLWGYSGEGPRGTIELLKTLGFDEKFSAFVGYETPRNYPDLGADWELRKIDSNWTFFIKGIEVQTIKAA